MSLLGQRGWLPSCLLLCITGDTVGHNQCPNSNYDPTVLRATFASSHSTNPDDQLETKMFCLDICSAYVPGKHTGVV